MGTIGSVLASSPQLTGSESSDTGIFGRILLKMVVFECSCAKPATSDDDSRPETVPSNAMVSETVFNCEFSSPFPNPAPFSSLVVAGSGDELAAV